MSMSGIVCSKSNMDDFRLLEKRKTEWLVLQIDNTEVSNEKLKVKASSAWGQSEEENKANDVNTKGVPHAWHNFQKALTEYPCGLGMSYVSYQRDDGMDQEKLIFVYWSDDNRVREAVVKPMVYSATVKGVTNKVTSIDATAECNDLDEISYKEIVMNASKGKCKF